MKVSLSFRVLALVGAAMLASSFVAYWSGSALLDTGAQLAAGDDATKALEAGRDGLVLWRKERQAWAEQSLVSCHQRGVWPHCLPPHSLALPALNADGDERWLDDERYFLRPSSLATATPYEVTFAWEPIKPRFTLLNAALKTAAHLESLWSPLLHSLKLVFAAALLVATGTGLAVLWLLTRGFTRRIDELTAYARRLGAGDLLASAPARARSDELGILSETMASMAASLAAATERLVYQEKMASWQLVARKMAHEIKNPLTPISLVGEQLSRYQTRVGPEMAPVLAEASRVLREETAFLSRMVREFTHFARLPPAQLKTCDLVELLQDFVRQETSVGSANLCFDAPGQAATLAADRGMILQILRNLLQNAMRAKYPDKVTVILELKRAGPHKLGLSFTDDGPGVLEAYRDRLFDAYVTSRSTGEAEKGMGLGLTIARKIAAEHGGTLSLVRSDGTGACFYLELPGLPG